jgi:hypothetical protein
MFVYVCLDVCSALLPDRVNKKILIRCFMEGLSTLIIIIIIIIGNVYDVKSPALDIYFSGNLKITGRKEGQHG